MTAADTLRRAATRTADVVLLPAIRVGLLVAGAVLVGVVVLAISWWPPLGAVFIAFAIGVGTGIWGQRRVQEAAWDRADGDRQRLDAYLIADTRADLDLVGPITGQQKAVEQ